MTCSTARYTSRGRFTAGIGEQSTKSGRASHGSTWFLTASAIPRGVVRGVGRRRACVRPARTAVTSDSPYTLRHVLYPALERPVSRASASAAANATSTASGTRSRRVALEAWCADRLGEAAAWALVDHADRQHLRRVGTRDAEGTGRTARGRVHVVGSRRGGAGWWCGTRGPLRRPVLASDRRAR